MFYRTITYGSKNDKLGRKCKAGDGYHNDEAGAGDTYMEHK